LSRAGRPTEQADEAWRLAREAGTDSAEVAGARFVFPVLGAARERATDQAAGVVLPDVASVAAEARDLGVLGEGARLRMERRVAEPASAEAHRLLEELFRDGDEIADGGSLQGAGVAKGDAKSVATNAGTVIHRVLELVAAGDDLEAAGAALIAELVPRIAQPADVGAVTRRALEIWRAFSSGPLVDRFVSVAPHVVARELPVLVPPTDRDDGPVGFVTGTIDLVHRDPVSGDLVVVDYKTDPVTGETELAERARAYAPQLEVYARALAGALGLSVLPRTEMWFVSGGRVVTSGPGA
jgi:ATP-dependent exoDNAse (exonuclease V) beta subunit